LKNTNQKIIIIGAGLSGLTTAYLLAKKDIHATVLDAASRTGGRIQTLEGRNNTPLELGATWFTQEHTELFSLLKELGIKSFKQFTRGKSLFQTDKLNPTQVFNVSENEAPSFRIAGGTKKIIDKLIERIDHRQVYLNTSVKSITEIGEQLIVKTDNGQIHSADKVILCLPPQLAGSSIEFKPALPNSISSLLPSIQTWMSGSIKFVIEYPAPFWRENGYSGMFFSHIGIISEMYDHTNFEENKFGFTGFLSNSLAKLSMSKRKNLVLNQLVKQLGERMINPLFYRDKIWANEFILGDNQIINRPHCNNGHPLLQKSYMNGKLFFSGTESNQLFPGYMEGAVRSANDNFVRIVSEKINMNI
jgi:monoamine oxidase